MIREFESKIKSAEIGLDNSPIFDLDLTKINKIIDVPYHLYLKLVYDDLTYIIEGNLHDMKVQIDES